MEKTKTIAESKQRNVEAYAFRDALFKKDIPSVLRFLIKKNKGREYVRNPSRTLILMDRTGSMYSLLEAAKAKIAILVEDISERLKVKGIAVDLFEVQLAVYGNYSCYKKYLFEKSDFTSKPGTLRTFMNDIATNGGQGNEAVECGLFHANELLGKNGSNYIDQIVLLGDMPPNTPEECTSRQNYYRGRHGKYGSVDNSLIQIEKLRRHNVPIYTFYLENYRETKKSFEEIAAKTNGKSYPLDVKSPTGSKDLADALAQRILAKVGEKTNHNELVEEYCNDNNCTMLA